MKLSITFMIELFYITIARANLNLTVPTLANVTAGQPFVIMWAGAASPITIDLVNAYNTKNATIVLTIGTALTGTSYTWNVPAIVPDLDYMFLLEDSQSSIYAGPFQILGVNFTSASTTSISKSTSSSSTSSSSSSTATPSNVSPPQKSSLSTGVKAGIGIGASVGSVLFVSLVGLLFFKQGRRAATKQAVYSQSSFEKPELGPGLPLSKEEKYELEARRKVAEIHGLEILIPVELEGQNPERWELEAMREDEVKRSELA